MIETTRHSRWRFYVPKISMGTSRWAEENYVFMWPGHRMRREHMYKELLANKSLLLYLFSSGFN